MLRKQWFESHDEMIYDKEEAREIKGKGGFLIQNESDICTLPYHGLEVNDKIEKSVFLIV